MVDPRDRWVGWPFPRWLLFALLVLLLVSSLAVSIVAVSSDEMSISGGVIFGLLPILGLAIGLFIYRRNLRP